MAELNNPKAPIAREYAFYEHASVRASVDGIDLSWMFSCSSSLYF